MKRFAIGAAKRVGRALGYGVVGATIVLIALAVVLLERRPDLDVWHDAELDEEFTVHSDVQDFEGYLALEDRLFTQLDRLVYDHTGPGGDHSINRYQRGSLSDPQRWPRNWNRSFELPVDAPRAGVLLLHGLSDSPYSVRHLAERLHGAGAWVVGLRIPGHGTAPSGLTSVTWLDMAAAVSLAARHVSEKAAGKPLLLVGYSNGGALSVNYVLSSLEDDALPKVSRVALMSPEIGITGFAALAVWQARLGHLLGLHKLEWNSIDVEYDPYKYGSFAVNAGDLAYRLTTEIQSKLDRLAAAGQLQRMPPVLAFQSAVDATVSVPATVQNFFEKLPRGDHELVLFDLNRITGIEAVLKEDPGPKVAALVADPTRAFELSIVTNENGGSPSVVARRYPAGKATAEEAALNLKWPRGLFSLTHVALPFSADDPLYGGDGAAKSPGIYLGLLALRGERGVLQISASDMLRLRWNPFFSYLESRLTEFLLPDDSAPGN